MSAARTISDELARARGAEPQRLVHKPPTLRQVAEGLYLLASSGKKLSDLRRQKQRERLEAEIRADLEFGR